MTLKGAIILTICLSALFGIFVCLGVIVYDLETQEREWYKDFNNWKILIMFFASSIAILSGVIIPIETDVYNKNYENVIYEIKSLKTENLISGRFFLGCGYVNTQEYYFFYVEYNKGYKIEKIETSRTYINALENSDYETPKLTQKKNKGEWDAYYIIYIPQDYIVFDFNI